MNKLLSVMMVAVLPGLALGSGEVATDAQARTLKPVISIIDLSPEQAQALERVHGDYQAKKAVLDVDYNARVDAVVEVKVTHAVAKN
jgi:hypothetical protein